ncbi:MAG: sigma-70 family RNA polymerase sigma factor [bacterium]|nr:sigma-70 family RNA polymerase sigma factor [bacterium]
MTAADPDSAHGPAELEALLREAGWVRRLARRLAHDQAAADDVAQGTMALALERRPRSRGSLRPWLARVAVRLAQRQRRADARRQAREERAAKARGATSPASDELLERLEQQQRIAAEVRHLPEPYRGVLLRRFYEGQSPATIARATNTTPATVRSQIARGLERLREQCGRGRELHATLPFLLLAAGMEHSPWASLGAEILAMKSSLKVAAGTALVSAALLGTGLFTGLIGGDADTAHGALPTTLESTDEDAQPLEDTVQAETEPQRVEAGARDPETATRDDTEAATASPEQLLTNVTARVVDDTGQPLAGARLASIYSDGRPRGKGNFSESDAEGRVTLALADSGVRHWRTEVFPMVFAASSSGHATSFVVSTPRWHGATDLGDIALGPGGALIGIVVDAWSQPIPDAVLYAAEPLVTTDLGALRIAGPDTTIVRPRADSGADGRFVLSGIVPGRVRLWVHAKDHLWTITDPIEVDAGAARDRGTIVLEEVPVEQRITGVVLRPDGNPAANARIAFESNALMQEGSLTADGQGRFRLVPRGDAPVRAIARDATDRFGPSAVTTVRIGTEVELRLTEKRVIALLVTDPSGQPIERASVMPFIQSESGRMDGMDVIPGQDRIRTDADGRLQVPVPAETFLISGSKTGYDGRRLGPFEPKSAPAELTLELVPEPQIDGRVLAYGKPVAGMRISIAQRIPDFVPREAGFPIRFFNNRGGEIESGPHGRFQCPVDKEWTEITTLATGDAYATGETELTVAKGEGASGVVIEVTHGGVVTGTVLPPPGQSASGYVVAASRGDGFPVWTRADEDGRYRLEHLTPGAWRVEGRDREPAREVLSVANRPEDKEFNWNVGVVDGEEVQFDVDMRGLGDIELSGRFTIDGEPAQGWTAELVAPRETMQREARPAAELDRTGNFTLTARAGRYDLRLLGTLPGGVRVEVLREVQLEGTRREWDGTLTTGALSESVEGDHEEVRLVRGHYYEGDREITHAPVTAGHCDVRIPSGRSSLQTSAGMTDFGQAWQTLRMVDVP